MHFGIPINILAEGSFVIEKRNIETNEVWHYESDNVCLPSINRILRHTSAYSSNDSLFTVSRCKCQFGSGTVEPTTSDTALSNLLWTIDTNTLEGRVSDDGTKFISTFTFVIPASSSYVGNITELGLRYYYMYSYTNLDALMTHSLFKDAESNPYTIQKTDLDQITVTYTITLTFSNPSIMPAMAWANTDANEIYTVMAVYNDYRTNRDRCDLTLDCRRRKVFAGNKCVLVPFENGNLSVINNEISQGDSGFNSTNIVTLPVTRADLSHVLNGHFINALTITKSGDQQGKVTRVDHKTRYNPLAVITLPNATLFPIYTLQDYSIGTGDGAVQDFTPPIPMWLAGSEQIYVDSVLQVNGVDYTCDNLHNMQKNLELTPMYQASIIDGIKTAVNEPYIDRIYISDNSEINTGGANTYLMTRVYETATPHTYSNLKLDSTHPFVIELDDTFDTRIDEIYLWTYYAANDQAAQYDIVTIEASSDKTNWDLVLDRVAGADANHSTSDYPYTATLTAGWKKYTLPSTINKKYWKVSVAMAGATAYHNRFGLVMMHAGRPIHFNTAPNNGAVITMNCNIDRPYKDANHVLDTSATMTL